MLIICLALLAIGVSGAPPILDLSQPFSRSETYPSAIGEELIAIADAEPDISAFVALECGQIVAEYGDTSEVRHLFSVTKSWSGTLWGIMEKEGLISLDETLWDVWPNDDIWANVEDAEARKQITLEQLVQMRGGFEMPGDFMQDVLIDTLPFNDNRLGGSDFEDSLTYHVLNTNLTGHYYYAMAGNLVSYVTLERSGMTPEEYAKEKLFPYLGITEDDYEWYVNPDQVQTSFHGLKMNALSMIKLGTLFLQNGMANENHEIVPSSWIERSWTNGDETSEEKFGYLAWWLGTEPEYGTYGFGGQRISVNTETNRVVAILSDTYYKDAGLMTYDDPLAPFPTDQIKEKFTRATPSTPITCDAGVSVLSNGDPSSSTRLGIPLTSMFILALASIMI